MCAEVGRIYPIKEGERRRKIREENLCEKETGDSNPLSAQRKTPLENFRERKGSSYREQNTDIKKGKRHLSWIHEQSKDKREARDQELRRPYNATWETIPVRGKEMFATPRAICEFYNAPYYEADFQGSEESEDSEDEEAKDEGDNMVSQEEDDD
ncbi:hypothetical protein Gohar_022275 [Gossypium harknessii]|uniref:Uncharacterized protein n=1 Tax=Gossypium harknessii TaxID=34285 RepID=A0A7J9IG78_9ROSI|nr:hypothetical protein [Gossypium harknessii]